MGAVTGKRWTGVDAFEHIRLVEAGLARTEGGAPFIQFTYAMVSPITRKGSGLKSQVSDWVLRNIPPARVWVYRRAKP